MKLLHQLTFLLRRGVVLVLAFGVAMPVAIIIYWLCPADWRFTTKDLEEGK